MSYNINHPKHYNADNIEVIEAIEDWKLGFHLGNVIKYVARSPHKGTQLEDLKKASWYLLREIERLTKLETIKDPTTKENKRDICGFWEVVTADRGQDYVVRWSIPNDEGVYAVASAAETKYEAELVAKQLNAEGSISDVAKSAKLGRMRDGEVEWSI